LTFTALAAAVPGYYQSAKSPAVFGGAQVQEVYRIRLDRDALLLESIMDVIKERNIQDGALRQKTLLSRPDCVEDSFARERLFLDHGETAAIQRYPLELVSQSARWSRGARLDAFQSETRSDSISPSAAMLADACSTASISDRPQEQVYLVLFGTGIRGRTSLAAINARVGDQLATVQCADAQSEHPGLDQEIYCFLERWLVAAKSNCSPRSTGGPPIRSPLMPAEQTNPNHPHS
jgi:hypothetical protein